MLSRKQFTSSELSQNHHRNSGEAINNLPVTGYNKTGIILVNSCQGYSQKYFFTGSYLGWEEAEMKSIRIQDG